MVITISVSARKRNWQLLDRKIARGISIEEAAIQCGIPMEEVFAHVSELAAQVDTLNFELRRVGQGAIKNALDKLTKLASGDPREGKDFESTDLEAAKALAKFGIDALRLSRAGGVAKEGGGDSGEQDLFDAANPWKLKTIS